MHEWALAEAVVSSAVKFSRKNGLKKLSEVVVSFGEMQQIDREVFEFALSEMAKSMGLEFKLVLRTQESLLKCKGCGTEWDFSSDDLGNQEKECIHFIPEIAHSYVKCPKCGSPDFRIVKGRGIWIDSIKGE